MQKIGVIHYNWPDFTFEQFLGFAAESGYGYVELNLNDVWGDTEPSNLDEAARRVRRHVESFGLHISALSAGNDFVQLDPAVIASEVERMKKVVRTTCLLHDDAVVRTEGGQPKDEVPPERYEEAMYECFSRCIPFVEEMNVGLAVDNHGVVSNDGDLLHSLLTRIDHPLIGTNLDTMNYRWFGHDLATCNRYYEMMAPLTLHTHFKDGFDSRENYKGAALGDGEIHLFHALECLRQAGYEGVYCAEYEGPEARGGIGYRKCAEWLKANVPG